MIDLERLTFNIHQVQVGETCGQMAVSILTNLPAEIIFKEYKRKTWCYLDLHVKVLNRLGFKCPPKFKKSGNYYFPNLGLVFLKSKRSDVGHLVVCHRKYGRVQFLDPWGLDLPLGSLLTIHRDLKVDKVLPITDVPEWRYVNMPFTMNDHHSWRFI